MVRRRTPGSALALSGAGLEGWPQTSCRTASFEAKAKPFAEALPELAASIRRGRGPNKAPTKKLVSLRLSGQVIEKYKAGGPGWQSRIDQDLRRINKIR